MATLVLTAVGTALGGPIGGALGALVGQSIDATLLAPKPRHGPRLGELTVQTSSYGTAIPKLFGTMRVAGTVIWSTDLQERRSTTGGGKGRPRTVNYSYSASFAVALSGRPIRAVRRIWADGKLLRGAAGDFKSETKYRLHRGGEDQAADPLIASAEGASGTPAFRGIAYAMFEDFQLADFGNRIPSLTFEVEADAGPVPIGTIAEVLSGGLVASGTSPALAGYAAGGDGVRGALQDLAGVFPLSLMEDEAGLRLGVAEAEPLSIAAVAEGAKTAAAASGQTERARVAGAPRAVEIAHYEPARDYQTGLQRAVWPEASGEPPERIALPAVLDAGAAKTLAEARLDRLDAERVGATLFLPWRHAAIRPGARVRLADESGLWRVARRSLEAMRVRLELLRLPGAVGMVPAPADPGRPTTQPDLRAGPTTLRLLDLPLYPDQPAERPRLLVAAAGAEAGWRSAALSISYDRGASWQAAGTTAAPAVLGTALGALPPGSPALLDTAGTVDVELLNPAMTLESRDDQGLAGGANLALLGEELVQFGRAEQVGSRQWRLSRLLRGRFGTEWAAAAHQEGEPFLLVEADSLTTIEPPAALLGGEVRLLAAGLGDGDEGVEALRILTGEVLRPPAPAHLRAARTSDGGIDVSWVRRSRSGWRWLDAGDAPLGEEAESYRLSFTGQGGGGRTLTLSASMYRYEAEAQAADGVAGPVAIEVAQLGSHAGSRPARLVLN